MRKSGLKNIVFLKEVNSNIVDEAIIILKPNVKCEEYVIQGDTRTGYNEKENDFVINEAKMVLANYISKLRNDDEKKIIKFSKKLKKMKIINFIMIVALAISIFLRII